MHIGSDIIHVLSYNLLILLRFYSGNEQGNLIIDYFHEPTLDLIDNGLSIGLLYADITCG